MNITLQQFFDYPRLLSHTYEHLRNVLDKYGSDLNKCNNLLEVIETLSNDVLACIRFLTHRKLNCCTPETLEKYEAIFKCLTLIIKPLIIKIGFKLERSASSSFETVCELYIATLILGMNLSNHDKTDLLSVTFHLCGNVFMQVTNKSNCNDNEISYSMHCALDLLQRIFVIIEENSEQCECIADSLWKNFLSADATLCNELSFLIDSLFQSLLFCDKPICSRILIELFPKILVVADKSLSNVFVNKLNNAIIKSFGNPSGLYYNAITETDSNGYLLLACTSDYLLPGNENGNCFWKETVFWQIIQHGLTDRDSLNRKRSLYLLKRALVYFENCNEDFQNELFMWNLDNKDVIQKSFENILFVLETLEEKQVHLIKPVFSVVQKLILTAHITQLKNGDSNWCLHVTWIMVILQQMLTHDSKMIRKWAVEEVCTLDLRKVPFHPEGMQKFLLQSFMKALNDVSLYTRQASTPIDIGSSLADKLQSHFVHCFVVLKTVEAQAWYLQQFLQNVNAQEWSDVPLFYITKALSCLPPASLLMQGLINDLRELIVKTLRTHNYRLRGAVQEFLLKTFLNLINWDSITLDEVASILVIFKRKQCLCRGTSLWNSVVERFCELQRRKVGHLAAASIGDFVRNSIKCILDATQNPAINDHTELHKTSRMISLFADMETNDKMIAMLESILKPFVQAGSGLLNTAYSRLYMLNENVEICMSFLIILNKEVMTMTPTKEDSLTNTVQVCIGKCAEEFMPFFQRRMFKDQHQDLSTFESLDIYFEFTKILVRDKRLYHTLEPFIEEICKSSFAIIENVSPEENFIQHAISIECFSMACIFLDNSDGNINLKRFSIPSLMKILISCNRLCTVPKTTDKIKFACRKHKTDPNQVSAEYIKCIWDCVHFYVNKAEITMEEVQQFLLQGTEALHLDGAELLVTVFKCFQQILSKVLAIKPESVVLLLNRCFDALFENKPSFPFWNAVNAFVLMAFSQTLMCIADLNNCLSDFAIWFYEKSECYHGLYLPLVKQVVTVWKTGENMSSILNHCDIVIQALTFGHIHRRDQRIIQDTEAYIMTLKDTCSTSKHISSNYADDKLVRVEAVIFLLERNSEEMIDIVPVIVHKLLQKIVCITKTKKRHYANSMIHRVQQRIWQSLLILVPHYSEEVGLTILNKIFELFISEAVQVSVRQLMEWLVTRILLKWEDLLKHFWNAMDETAANRVGSMCSFLSILCHIEKSTSNKQDKLDFYQKAISVTVPWTLSHHPNTRMYAKVAFCKLWQSRKIDGRENLEPIFIACRDHKETKNASKLECYFDVFHPEKHFTLETIFYEVPRLTNVSQDEWLEKDLFVKGGYETSRRRVLAVPLVNADESLSACQTGAWTIQDIRDETDETSDELGDLQRKWTPWKQMLPNYEMLELSSEVVLKRKKQQLSQGLIVVASLIDKAPNLGGLCRTCEVFGASRYVIGSLRYVEDKQFQSLSVSSEKWVPLQEVKAPELNDYLRHTKKLGYTIIGVEQTANSISVNSFDFPRETVLVLGNEKEGLPVNIIQMMDVCVEIPQQGLIRSLNVHVTGAIIIWEYARQHLRS